MATSVSVSVSESEQEIKHRSDIWKYFERISGERKAKCTICCKILAYCGGTTNLRDHLTSKHPLHYEYEKRDNKTQAKQGKIDSFVKSHHCSDKLATERIADMIALDLRPISSFEGEGLCSIVTFLQPGYRLPSRKYITTVLKRKHDVGKEQLKKNLKKAFSVSLTTDIWSSLATEGYITVSAHYLTPDWDMCSYVLETSGFPERHIGDNIANKLCKIGEQYDLNNKVSTVVHDCAANMVRALEILNDMHGWQSLLCSAHSLQLCLNPGLAIDRLIKAARKLVGHFKHSVLAKCGVPSSNTILEKLLLFNFHL